MPATAEFWRLVGESLKKSQDERERRERIMQEIMDEMRFAEMPKDAL